MESSNIKLCELKKKDVRKAIEIAVKGMNLDIYTDSKIVLSLYSKYFWYSETLKATQIIAAYKNGKFLGVIAASIRDEKYINNNILKRSYIWLFENMQKILLNGSVDIYTKANKEMYQGYIKTHKPDGEITLFAVDKTCGINGIGTTLLNELERREKGKELYLFTDDKCTYQFYEHRGFIRNEEKDIVLKVLNKSINLTCFLYSKKC